MSDRFRILDTPLRGLKVVERMPIGDRRGYLERLYCADEFEWFFAGKPVVQVNRSLTRKQGTVRGMHFQRPPHSEAKLVTCLAGSVFDVAVDVRRDSQTFLHWHGEVLSAEGHRSLLIPEGFAHGFQTLEEDCQLLYLHSANYQPGHEAGVHPQDPALAIAWPEPVAELSARDIGHPLLGEDFDGVAT
jgi:dTDP-4-dehydrorhamnose 3,5-epimerase